MSSACTDQSIVSQEDYIVWLRNPELYDYLREGVYMCNFKVRFPLKKMNPAKHTDGGLGAHIVAYACLKVDAATTDYHCFMRRYWWVKEYDRFIGRKQHKDCYDDPHSAPCEAVDIDSIIAGMITESYDPDETMLCD